MRLRTRLLAVATAVGLAATAGISLAAQQSDRPAPPGRSSAGERPNIIFFQVDDMSAELLKYMDNVRGLASNGGTEFPNHFFVNALCCPSRASTFLGQHPHNTGVLTNKGADRGGYSTFEPRRDETYLTELHRMGYRTGYLGKYLNEYQISRSTESRPQGIDEWHVADGGGYNEFRYNITRYVRGQSNQIRKYDGKYMTDLLSERARGFIKRSRSADKPFFMQVTPFGPHSRGGWKPGDNEPHFPPAKRDRPGAQFPNGDCGPVDCSKLDVTELGAFNENTADKKGLPWIRQDGLRPKQITQLQKDFKDRVRMVQSIDDMVGRVLKTLSAAERGNTYVLFTSDNGFHLGQHRFLGGKSTAYDHDIRVPLLVKRPTGAGPAGKVVRNEVVQNLDLFATFLDLAEEGPSRRLLRDGHSLLGLIHDKDPDDWREAALIQHRKPRVTRDAKGVDPDIAQRGDRTPYDYRAVRLEATVGGRRVSELFVQYLLGDRPREYYNRVGDPHELTNDPDNPRTRIMADPLTRLSTCGNDAGDTGCWQASQLENFLPR